MKSRKPVTLFLTLILSIFLIVSSNAESLDIPRISESLSLRGGIKSGMSLNEVIQFESNNGNTDYSSGKERSELIYKKEIHYSTNIAGYDYSTLFYFFDKQSTCMGVGYIFGDGDHPVNGEKIHDEMYSTLVQKYGEPLSKNELLSDNLYSPLLNFAFYTQSMMKMLGRSYSIHDFSQWLIAYEDCYLLIDLYLTTPQGSSPMLNTGYRFLNESELKTIIGNDLNTQNEMNEKRQNDL